jgi:hypothetical protein
VPASDPISVFPWEAAITLSSYLQGKAEICVRLPGAAFMQRTEVWCASAGLPPGAVGRAGVRKAPPVTALAPHPSAGATVWPAKAICMSRFVPVRTNGYDLQTTVTLIRSGQVHEEGTMPIVFVHGVNNRRLDVDYAEREKQTGRFLVDVFAPELGLTLAPESIFFPYWGDHGVKFRWNQASLPSSSDPVEVLSSTSRRASEDFELCIEEARFQYGPGAVSFGQVSRNKGFLKAVDLVWDVASAVMSSDSSHDDLIEGYSASLRYARGNPAPPWAMQAQSLSNEEFVRQLFNEIEAVRRQVAVAPTETLGLRDWVQSLRSAIDRLNSMPGDAATTVATRLWRKSLHDKASCFLGDIFIYLSQRGTPERPGPIVQEVLDGLHKGYGAKQPGDDRLIVIGHSFGGVIVYDIMTYFAPHLRFDAFVSVGSQVALFEEMTLYGASRVGVPPNPPAERLKPPSNFGKWVNVYDTNDVFSFRASTVFEGPDDYRFDTGYGLLEAHGGYFSRPSFYRRLAKRLSA